MRRDACERGPSLTLFSLPSTLESLIAPSRTSIGQSLLQKLGWRPGQGIGPRVTLRKLRLQEGKGREEDPEDPEAGRHTFAPRDARLLVYEAKEGREGLGYQKGRGMGALPKHKPGGRFRFSSTRVRLIEVDDTALGAGHVDDEEDDPYGASGSGVEYVFDNAAAEDDDLIVMGGPSRSSHGSKTGDLRADDQERWHDGRAVLSGFAMDPLGVPVDKWCVL